MKNLFDLFKRALIAVLTLGLIAVPPVNAGDNHLHYGFHGDGKTLTNFLGASNDEAYAVAINGTQIVVAGTTDNGGGSNFCVMRYNSTGGLVTAFGTNGKVQTDFGGNDFAVEVKVLGDGKIVVAGYVVVSAGVSDFAVARYNADGSLDTTFSGDGKQTIDFQGGNDAATSMTIDADGKIIVAGYANSALSWGLARLNTNGTLDTTFSGDGKVITDIGLDTEIPYGVIALPDGKLIAGGVTRPTGEIDTDFAIVQYNANGTLDTSFSGDGKVITDINGLNNWPYTFKRDRFGRYLLGGESDAGSLTADYMTVARYTADGALDTTFNSAGWVLTDLNPTNSEVALDLAVNDFGDVTVAGRVYSSSPDVGHFVLVRYLSNGQRDLNFGTNGRVNTIFGTGGARANAIAISPGLLDPDLDTVYAVGTYSPEGDDRDFAVARYTVRGPAAPSQFFTDGEADFSVFRPSDGNWYLLNSETGAYQIVHWGQAGDIPTPGDFDGDGISDPAVFRGGVWYSFRSSDGGVTITQFGFADDKPVQGDYDGDGRTDIAVFRPSNGVWHLLRSTLGYTSFGFGLSEDKPTQGDFDGDGLSDAAVFRPSNGVWYLLRSTLGFGAVQFGLTGDWPVPSDYDGDGKTDIAVYRPSTGIWYTINSQTNTNLIAQFGISTDIPGPADFDGDGRSDLTVFRPSSGVWYSLRSSDGGATIVGWGLNGDIPISSAYTPR